MRTTRILTAALALPALTTALLVPLTSSAAAATPTASQTLTGYCNPGSQLTPLSSSTNRVSLNEDVEPQDRHAGFADATTLSAGAFTRAERNAVQTAKQNCDVRTGFSNVVRILPGTSGLAAGAPVTLTALISLDASLSSTLDYTTSSSAMSSVDAKVEINDPGAVCDEWGDCQTSAVYFSASAERDVNNVDPATVDHPWGDADGGLSRDEDTSWDVYSNQGASDGDSTTESTVICPSFPCSGGAEGPYSGGMPGLTFSPDVQPVSFTTSVGATLQVTGKLVAYAFAAYGTTTATSNGMSSLDVDITDAAQTGVEIVVGSAPTDSTAPTTGSTVDVEPNGLGWNNGPVQVTLTAQDETALAGITYSAVGAHPLSGSGPAPRVLTISEPGTTTVSWTATDVAGNTAHGERTIRIDTTAPSLTVPPAVSAPASAAGTAVVSYTTYANDDLSGVGIDCTHPSGSTFPLGETTVVCTATDGAGNDSSRQFVVTVTEPSTVAGHLAALRELISVNPMDEVLRKQLLNDLVLLEKAYEKGRGTTKGCKELGDLQLRVTTAFSIEGGVRSAILTRAGQLGELLGC